MCLRKRHRKKRHRKKHYRKKRHRKKSHHKNAIVIYKFLKNLGFNKKSSLCYDLNLGSSFRSYPTPIATPLPENSMFQFAHIDKGQICPIP